MIPLDRVSVLLQRYDLCDACLGRQFKLLVEGETNAERGKNIRSMIRGATPPEKCYICSAIRPILPKLEEKALQQLEKLCIDSLLVGVTVPDDVIETEDTIRLRYGLVNGESIKRELARELGERLAEKTGLEIDFERPDVTLIFDLSERRPRVTVQINPVFIFGRYRKFERGLSQTDRYCRKCRGKGCEECGFTGLETSESIESMIAIKALEAFRGEGWRFHGSGREDVDARMLGNGRPFVLEILKPKTRHVDLAALQAEVNSSFAGRIEIVGLRRSSRREMQRIKTRKFDKTYEVTARYSGDLDDCRLESLVEELSGCEIRQRTPLRVLPRRKDMVRKRLVKYLEILEHDGDVKTFRARLRCESGLYVKELFNGDQGRTEPNVKDLLGVEEISVEELDVVTFHDDFGW